MDTLYRGDAYPLSIAWDQPETANPWIEDPLTPIDATVLVVRERDGQVVLAAGTPTITGNVTTYLVAPETIAIDGAYTAYLTATFADSNRVTQRVPFVVLPKR